MSRNIDNLITLPSARNDLLIDYTLGDLSPVEAQALEQRLAEDGLLRVEFFELRKRIESLRDRRGPLPAIDITAAVMAKIRDEYVVPDVSPAKKIIAFPYRRWIAAVAALLLVFAGALITLKNRSLPQVSPDVVLRDTPEPAMIAPLLVAAPQKSNDDISFANLMEPPNEDVEWLKSAQLADGSWDAVTWGGTWQARPGLTALVLCGLMKAESERIFTGSNADTANRALSYLLASARDPSVNSRSAVVHQQQVLFVGVALQEARRLCRDDQIILQIDEALANLSIQNAAGSLSMVSVMIPHLPEEAAIKGGRVYLVARAMLIDS